MNFKKYIPFILILLIGGGLGYEFSNKEVYPKIGLDFKYKDFFVWDWWGLYGTV